MRNPSITALAAGAALTLVACGGESGAETDASAPEASEGSGADAAFPELSEGKGPGSVSGMIAGNPVEAEGVCATSTQSFDFWTDGTDFANARDTTGDGQYLILNVVNMNGKVRSALRYSKDGETIYNGLVSYESFDGSTVRVDTPLGREQKISADLTMSCE